MHLLQRVTRLYETLIMICQITINFFLKVVASIFEHIHLFFQTGLVALGQFDFCVLIYVKIWVTIVTHERKLCLDFIEHILSFKFLLISLDRIELTLSVVISATSPIMIVVLSPRVGCCCLRHLSVEITPCGVLVATYTCSVRYS